MFRSRSAVLFLSLFTAGVLVTLITDGLIATREEMRSAVWIASSDEDFTGPVGIELDSRCLARARTPNPPNTVGRPLSFVENTSSARRPLRPGSLAIVTAYKRSPHKELFTSQVYESMIDRSITNMVRYGTRHGIPVFFLVEDLFRRDVKAAFVRIEVFKRFFSLGFEWVMWTDVDWLFYDFSQDLHSKLALAGDGHDAIVSYSCLHPGQRRMMSGTMILRNSAVGERILETWENVYYPIFRKHVNHDQMAFQAMMWNETALSSRVLVLPCAQFMSYAGHHASSKTTKLEKLPEVVFGLHFPGTDKAFFNRYDEKSRALNGFSKSKRSLHWTVS